jgi:integrase
MKPTVNFFLDTRRELKNGKYSLKLSVTAKRINRSWSLGFEFTKEEYAKLLKNQRRDPYKDTWNAIQAKLDRAERIIKEMMPFFNFQEFKDRFFHDSSLRVAMDSSSLLTISGHLCKAYQERGQYSMVIKIQDSVRSILKFAGKDNISMRSITPAFCQRYEEYMLAKSRTHTRNGAGVNLRHIRIVFNHGIKQGMIPKEWYPFDDYVIPFERKFKKPLSKAELIQLKEFDDFGSEAQARAHTAFLASFYFNGAYASDFLRFRFSDIHGDFIVFYRQKTRNSRKHDLKPIRVFLTPEIRQFIRNHGNDPSDETNFILPYLKKGMTFEEERQAIIKFNQQASKSLKVIKRKLGLAKDLNMKNARHTLANILKNHQVDREFIKDIFGHHSIVTTEHYLESMEDARHKSIMESVASLTDVESRVA